RRGVAETGDIKSAGVHYQRALSPAAGATEGDLLVFAVVQSGAGQIETITPVSQFDDARCRARIENGRGEARSAIKRQPLPGSIWRRARGVGVVRREPEIVFVVLIAHPENNLRREAGDRWRVQRENGQVVTG